MARGKSSAKPLAAKRFPACQSCGSRDLRQVTERSFECGSCTSVLAPTWLSSEEDYIRFKEQVEIRRSSGLKLWGQKVLHRSIPIVVLVNWSTCVYFFLFFLLGMAGLFSHPLFQQVFLYSSVVVVALGFGIIARWGKTRISL